jgi:FkbM family methyltransferase
MNLFGQHGRQSVRNALRWLCCATPDFRGKGRIVLVCDQVLTDYSDAHSYTVVAQINNLAVLELDLRSFGQRFAYYYGELERDLIAVCRRLYRGGTFVDIGSSLGLYGVCLADLVAKARNRVISVEPLDFNVKRQVRNLTLNRYNNLVEIYKVALGVREGTVKISGDPSFADSNALISDDGDWQVEMCTLDTLLQDRSDRIGLIKMDVEGYECEVIAGGRGTILRDRPILLAEFNRERMTINRCDIQPTWSFFAEADYQFFVCEGAALRQIEYPETWENIFFIPRESL